MDKPNQWGFIAFSAAVAGIFVLAGVGCGARDYGLSDSLDELASMPDVAVTDDFSPELPVYTLEDLAKHNVPEDCWMAIHGKVYDSSNKGKTHPGGEAIYAGCGIDATELFETRPMGSGTPHSDRARKFLEQSVIGQLAE